VNFEIDNLIKALINFSNIKLDKYCIGNSLPLNTKNFIFRKDTDKENLENHYQSIYWLFNDLSYGDYCREYKHSVKEIISYLTYYIENSDESLYDIRVKIESIIENQVWKIISQEEEIKNRTLENSIVTENKGILWYNEEIQILHNSLNVLFDFRIKELKSLCNALANLIDNYIYYPDKYRRHIFCKECIVNIQGTLSFCWNKNRDFISDLVKLHTLLRESEFIDRNTSIQDLKTAFNGSFLKVPLKIKWIKLVKGKTSKALLFHLIDRLEQFNYIDLTEDNLSLFNKIEYVFCDSDGFEFQNLAVSKSQWLNQRQNIRTPQEVELDSVLYSIYYS